MAPHQLLQSSSNNIARFLKIIDCFIDSYNSPGQISRTHRPQKFWSMKALNQRDKTVHSSCYNQVLRVERLCGFFSSDIKPLWIPLNVDDISMRYHISVRFFFFLFLFGCCCCCCHQFLVGLVFCFFLSQGGSIKVLFMCHRYDMYHSLRK